MRHKGLKRLIEDDEKREIRPDLLPRLRRILTGLITAQDMAQLKGRPAGEYTSLQAIGQERGAFLSPATGG